ncbi:hypothetical protein ABMA27_014299 [Loxostege sticticalis]|uniref:DUF5641 domain-containing protein n=1 Tax=Loxostege sticticalis TaxID=481309 RepID=A0ABR3IDG2_LOXSC
MDLEWHFNAPTWASAGGLWESCVKSLKFHLRRVLGTQKLTYEELATLLSQLEACLNSRPLCALSEDPEDINFLTPSHFLSSGPTLNIMETERDGRTRWQLVQKIFTDTWKRWQSEYLCQLSARSKWRQKQENLKTGDIVVIHDANLPPGKWALGRIVELHPGKDNFVRVVSIKTKTNIIKRPITKISLLLTDSNTEVETSVVKNAQQHTEPGVKTRRARSKRSCNFVTLAMTLLFVALLYPVQCAYNLVSLNSSQSIYFDKVSNMHLIRDQWKLIVYYDMDPYWQGLHMFEKYIKGLENICSKQAKQTKCDVVLLQLRHEAAELEYYNNVLLGQQLAHSRRRRGLINGVGYLAHSLFGVLDDEFAQQYEKDINLIRKNERHLAQLWKNQTSIVEAENNLLSRIEQSMDKQHKIFNKHIMALENASNTIAKELQNVENTNEFMMSSVIANSIVANLKNIQETLLDTVTNIYYGKFNMHLLTPDQLRKELSIISGQLSQELVLPIDNIQANLRNIYHLLKVKARMTNQYFIFEILVPLVSRDNFDMYRLIAVPQQTREDMVHLTPVAEYLAINIKKDSYIPLSEEEVHRCIQYDVETHLCPLQKPINHLKSDDNLCKKNIDTNQCEVTTTTCEDTWVEINKINTYLYFCCNQCTIRLICDHEVKAHQLSKAGIITFKEGCIVKNEAFTILTHRTQVTNLNIKPDVVELGIPPINTIINLTIPIQHLEAINDIQHEEHQKRLSSIGQRIENMKDNEANPLLEDQMSSHDLHQYVILYILMGVIIAAVVAFAEETARVEPGHHENKATAVTTDKSSARVRDESTSPLICKRFSECE